MNSNQKQNTSYVGLGIIFGVPFGFIIGLLLFPENPASGIGIGISLGIIVGAIMDAQKNKSSE
jgi:uncharacterized membrane protein